MSTICHLINVGFLAALCVSLGLVCGHVTPSLRFQLVGFTAQGFIGDTGGLGFTLACQAEFPGSRMCTSEEVLNTVSLPAGLGGPAWVRPSFQPGGQMVVDASGLWTNNAEHLTCKGWSDGSTFGQGLGATADGSFQFRDCSTELG